MLTPSDDEAEEAEVLRMVSVSDSSAEGGSSGKEEFRTPPEGHSLPSSNEVDSGGPKEEDTVDLGADSEVSGSQCGRSSSSVHEDAEGLKKMEEVGGVTGGAEEKCVEGYKFMDEEEKDDLMVEEACCGASKGVVQGKLGKGNELLCKSKGLVEEVEQANVCVSDNTSPSVRKLPSSFCAGEKGGGVMLNDSGVRTRKRDAVVSGQGGSGAEEIRRGHSSAGAKKPSVTKGKEDASGKKPSASKGKEEDEPSEEELTDNILKMLSLLAQRQRPVFEKKVDILESAIEAGITFARPAGRAEGSDDDSD